MDVGSAQIGEIASLGNVSVDAVRYYERLGLLSASGRSPSGYRIFPLETVERIKFIKQAQTLGFSLEEIRKLFVSDGQKNQCQHVRNLILTKLTELDEKLGQIVNFKSVLNHHLSNCEAELTQHGSDADCPILTNVDISRTQ